MNNKKILVAMSGGVDSSVAAKLLIDSGNECVGCTMKLYENDQVGINNNTCCSLDDILDAKNVANRLNMKHYVFNFKKDFEQKIIKKFVNSYLNGITPNPCIDCNKYMKFDKLIEKMNEIGFDYISTGHYARIEYKNNKYLLKKGIDESKDQSYVLYFMNQKILSKTILPLGSYKKDEIRKIAADSNFINAKKHDSQDICFVPDKNYSNIIKKYNDNMSLEGYFINKNGKIIGLHKGIIYYTIGQHRKLGIELDDKYYVTNIDIKTNNITLGKIEDLMSDELIVENYNFIDEDNANNEFECDVKIRYSQKQSKAKLKILNKNQIYIKFYEKQKAITPGQSAVFYDEDIVLGGGIIKKRM